MAEALLFLAEQLETDIARRVSAAQRQAKYAAKDKASRQNDGGADVSLTSVSRQNDASLTSDASRVDILPSLSLPVERVREESPPINPPSEPASFGAFWSIYPKRAGDRDRKAASKAYAAAAKRVDFEIILKGAQRYAAHCDETGKTGTEFVRQARTWLNANGWEETYETSRNVPHGSHKNWSIASAVLAEQDRREGICREGSESDVLALPEYRSGRA